MGESYPRRDQARGLWKINDITKNIKDEGTYPQAYSNKGFFGGGNTGSNVDTIDQIIIQSAGNATDFGDLAQGKNGMASTGTPTRAFWLGGYTGGGSPNMTSQIDTINFATAGNCSDFGDMSDQRYMMGTAGNDTRICAAGGYASPSFKNVIDFITPTTLGDATDFGDLTGSRSDVGGTSNATRGVFFSGAPGTSNVIDFIEFSTTGNAVDFGDLPTALKSPTGSSTSTKGFISGGGSGSYPADTPVNTISEITFGTLGNATDFGDLTTARIVAAAVCDNTKSVVAGGSTSSSQDSRNTSNVIDSFTMSTRGNATDFGDLTVARNTLGGACGGHGGIEKSQPRAPELYSPTNKVVPRGGGVGDLGFHYGGSGPSDVNTIGVVQISALGTTQDFGDLTTVAKLNGGGSSATRGIRGGGQIPSTIVNTIDYWEMASKGNAADFGDLTAARRSMLGQAGNDTRGLFQGGNTPSESNVIDYITFATIGNATDFGDCVENMNLGGAVSSNTRGLNAGGTGPTPSYSVTIGYVTIASTGNATDFGDLTVARYAPVNVGSSTRGVFMGGYVPSPTTRSNVMDYVTIASTGNATDFGDIDSGRAYGGQASNQTRGLYMGGENSGSGNTANIQYITIASTGNSASFGDLFEQNMQYFNGCSNGHGGLS